MLCITLNSSVHVGEGVGSSSFCCRIGDWKVKGQIMGILREQLGDSLQGYPHVPFDKYWC